ADDGTHGSELWMSDGTAAGTVPVSSLAMSPSDLTNVNGTLFFAADDGTHGSELWMRDGTAAGTTLVADVNPGGASSYPSDLANVNGALFFAADDGTHGRELWTLVEDLPAPTLGDAGFESPALAAGTFVYDPAGTPWTFAGGAGISGNGSGF